MEPGLSDREKIDRAAWHEEVRFYKKQQWAVATAGVVLCGGFVAAINNLHFKMTEKIVAMVIIAVGAGIGGYVIDKLQSDLANVRRKLDPSDRKAKTRGIEIVHFQRAILTLSATFVFWILFCATRANSAQ